MACQSEFLSELPLFPQLADVEPGVFYYGGAAQDLWPGSGVIAV